MLILALYSILFVVALINWIWIPRLRARTGTCRVVFCIPARDEAARLPHVLGPLRGETVLVFDDESTDGTAEVARSLGASVISPRGPLPAGWTGKNRACHELAGAAPEADWVVFLDADTIPSADFATRLRAELAATTESFCTGFLRVLPGRGLEPAYLGWVFWILLATNPFGLVARTHRGHNGFLNGQFIAWRKAFLTEAKPYEQVKGEILEDVKLGRWLAKMRQPVRVLSTGESLSVQMYTNLREACGGMLKNSHAIAGGGSWALALFLLLLAWGWLAFWPAYFILLASKLITDRVSGGAWWAAPLMPFTLTAAAVTILLSRHLKRQGRLAWKGRTYS